MVRLRGKRSTMRITASSVLAITILLAGCSARQAMPPSAVAPTHGAITPQVVQTDKEPIHWEQFAWGDTTLVTPKVDIITGPDKNMWYTDYFDSTLIKMTMSGQTTSFPLSFDGGMMQ